MTTVTKIGFRTDNEDTEVVGSFCFLGSTLNCKETISQEIQNLEKIFKCGDVLESWLSKEVKYELWKKQEKNNIDTFDVLQTTPENIVSSQEYKQMDDRTSKFRVFTPGTAD